MQLENNGARGVVISLLIVMFVLGFVLMAQTDNLGLMILAGLISAVSGGLLATTIGRN